ncbi:hypothetical protein EDB85DRAFT_2155543 [Lactarius pseudohatsudake]|nr:hypothetical protein EDB85DRAFT_2155543 [Lactarius pseudohatsudake]
MLSRPSNGFDSIRLDGFDSRPSNGFDSIRLDGFDSRPSNGFDSIRLDGFYSVRLTDAIVSVLTGSIASV